MENEKEKGLSRRSIAEIISKVLFHWIFLWIVPETSSDFVSHIATQLYDDEL